jgi:hypothetical protein
MIYRWLLAVGDRNREQRSYQDADFQNSEMSWDRNELISCDDRLEAPPEGRAGLRSIRLRDYFAQQPPPGQQAPPPQQSAVREVAVAVPSVARAIVIINRYFISSSC